MASETGALGAGTSSPEIRANKRPLIKIDGDKKRTVKVGEPLPLVAWVTDDGVPKPRSAASDGVTPRALRALANASPNAPRNPALHSAVARHRQQAHRTAHVVVRLPRRRARRRFEPMQVKAWEDTRTGANSPWAPLWTPPPVPKDGKYTGDVTFDTPGTYVLRARADDGALFGDDEMTVTVTK